MSNSTSPLSSLPATPNVNSPKVLDSGKPVMGITPDMLDPEAEAEPPADEKEIKQAVSQPPPVNSSYLPLPWKGRLGYACLNTYLRTSNPPVFCSRTCRIASILENRHPLKDPSQPSHPTKNRPDRDQPADVGRGQEFVQELGLTNARDIIKMLRWNDRFGIKFMRLSSEMFPFASHAEYGYSLAPFASGVLAEAGRVAAELGHRLTVHPGQFTQLGTPRKEVVDNSIRDLEYHSEMLRLLKLPDQQNRDAVMILHMGGTFGDKPATLDRFRQVYPTLSNDIKQRLVLENDDVNWTVHDLLPICEELHIPMVLDYHHHNLKFDADKIREGTLDIMALYDRIKATWTKKGITQKMHYSEPAPGSITNMQRRKHSPRVQMLPPCDPTMDLMIEAKDKEQAVFDLMRTYKLPGFDRMNLVIPYSRVDDNKEVGGRKSAKSRSAEAEAAPKPHVPENEVGMGGPEGRVYWPAGMEEWLRPQKRGQNRKAEQIVEEDITMVEQGQFEDNSGKTPTPKKRQTKRRKSTKKAIVSSDSEEEVEVQQKAKKATTVTEGGGRGSARTKGKKVNYAEDKSS